MEFCETPKDHVKFKLWYLQARLIYGDPTPNRDLKLRILERTLKLLLGHDGLDHHLTTLSEP